MTRMMLAGMAVLLGLVAVGRIRERPVPVAPAAAQTPALAPGRAPRIAEPAPGTDSVRRDVTGTPAIDLLARLESRRRVTQAAPFTYFDSLLVDTDSVLRRWVEERPLLIAVRPDPSVPQLAQLVQRAIGVWQEARLGVQFQLISDTTQAQLVVQSAERLADGRAGLTNLRWSAEGVIHSASITLARDDSTGRPFPPQIALAIAVHEVGHALGLPHSGNPADVMYPVSGSGRLSTRDRATVELLYELPLGSLREQGHP